MGLTDLFIVRLYKQLASWGIDKNTPGALRKRILLTNSINLTTLTIIIPYSILFYLLGFRWLGILLIPVFALFVIYQYLNKLKYYLLSRTLMLISLNVILGFYAVAFGRFSSLHILYFVFLSLPLLLYELRNYVFIFICALSSVIGFLIVRFDVFPMLVVTDPFSLQVISVSITGVTMIWLFLNMYYVVRTNDMVEERLRGKNLELETEIQLRENAERTLKQNNQLLQAKNKELEQLTYITSHDLQEPLRTIISYIELLEKESVPKLGETELTYMRFITQSAYRLKKLIKALLDYTLIGRNYKLEIVNANIVAKDVVQDIEPFTADKNATVEVSGLPVVKAHTTDLKSLLKNLIINGIKFNKKDKPWVKVSATKLGNKWQFEVTDNGIGIEEKYTDRIFEIFQRLHSKDEFEGNGIGLAHCKKIVEMHGGEIWVESVPGKGSTFYFTLLSAAI